MKYHKGYNWAQRQCDRALARGTELYESGARFEDLWDVFEPLWSVMWTVPKDDTFHINFNKIDRMVQETARAENKDEQVSEYWGSVV